MPKKGKGRAKRNAGEQKKGRDGSTSSFRTNSQNQPKGKHTSHPSRSRSRGHGRHNTGATESEPLSKEAQTQTGSSRLENKETQTETVSHATQQTQTETNGNTETTEVSQPTDLSPEDVRMEVETVLSRNKGNESDGEKKESVERKKRRMSESREPTKETKERTDLSDGCREQDGDHQKDKDTNEKHLEGDLQKDTNLKSGTEEPKSYAAAAAAGKTKESKEEKKQTASDKVDSKKRKPSPVRAPEKQPMFTFYIYAVLDRRFAFDRKHDSLLLLFGNECVEIQIIHFVDLQQKGYLIEAKCPVWENIARGFPIYYKYAVQKQHGPIDEIALRWVYIPTEKTELHLYEGYISSSSRSVKDRLKNWFQNWFQNEREEICKHWETSAHVLLDRVFQKCGSFKYEDNKTLIEHLNRWREGFLSIIGRLKFPENFSPSQINVSRLISDKLSWILNGQSGGKTSESFISLEVALSVFQVCCGCSVDLCTKDWGKLCRVVSERTASLGEMQTTLTALPSIDFTVNGLMNQCSRKLISEVVLLVPVCHLLRKLNAQGKGAKSDPGSAMDEQSWAGLEKIEYRFFRERIRGLPDKRRMVLQMIRDHLPMTKDKPYLLKGWLAIVAFEDVPEFAKMTGSGPELLIQSLMYRMKETEQNTDTNRTEKDLEVFD